MLLGRFNPKFNEDAKVKDLLRWGEKRTELKFEDKIKYRYILLSQE